MKITREMVKHGRACESEYIKFREAVNKYQADVRIKTRNKSTKKYEKTKKGYLVRTYRNMKSRCCGILKSKAHLYAGLELIDKNEFYAWSLSDPDFMRLFIAYKESDFNLRMAPSIDRIDSKRGYILENMRWITFSENSRLGSMSRHRKRSRYENKSSS